MSRENRALVAASAALLALCGCKVGPNYHRLTIRQNQLVADVSLIEALGGGWGRFAN
jgi:hypothetical protein